MKIGIAADHGGFELKEVIASLLSEKHEVKDFGPFSSESCDYPDFAHPVADAVANNIYNMGILICGSGNGVCITANKHNDVREALCWEVEVAKLARMHNDANILCIPARFVTLEEAIEITNVFLETEFEGGRHQLRIDKIPC